MAPREHTDREFEEELARLRGRLAAMGAAAIRMIDDSVQALADRNDLAAHDVIERDTDLDRLEVEIDDLCLNLLAKRQPVAGDLRLIATAFKVVTDLERIGDLCVNVCERAIELDREPARPVPADVLAMGRAVSQLVEEVVSALESQDAAAARAVIRQDRTIDAYHAQVFREALRFMTDAPAKTQYATRLQAIGKAFERMGDHAANVAERVIYLAEGAGVRHAARLGPGAAPSLPHGVLFLCVHNAARSQMAEGWARRLLPPGINVWSAGSDPADAIDPLAVEAMREVGIDIAGQAPKRITEVPLGDVDTVITLCAEEVCVGLPGIMRQETWIFPDPKAVAGDRETRLSAYRAIRDAVRQQVAGLLEGRLTRPQPLT
jgi:phosphate transport system protein